MDVSAIRSAILHEASRAQPTALQRAEAKAAVGRGVTAQAFLGGSAAFDAQNLVSRLDGDVAAALADSTKARAAYGATAALIKDAYGRVGAGIDLTA